VKDYLPPDEARFLRPCPLGEGAGRVDETLDFLAASGFPGPLVLEVYSEEDHLGTIARARDHVRSRLV
jgi:L-ribulose-5-phosphate 3-epimerase UlaE